MTKLAIITLIIKYATILGVDPVLAVSVAKVESNFRVSAVGTMGEIGLFQVMPQFAREFSKEELVNPHTNIIVGLNKIKHAQKYCKHRAFNDFMICYNAGVTGGSKMKVRGSEYLNKVYTQYRYFSGVLK